MWAELKRMREVFLGGMRLARATSCCGYNADDHTYDRYTIYNSTRTDWQWRKVMRTFEVIRVNDETGISGEGKVIEGIVFSDGVCVTRWIAQVSPGRSTNIWDSYAAFAAVHIAPHPDNQTKVNFSDGEVYDGTVKVKKARKKKEPIANGR